MPASGRRVLQIAHSHPLFHPGGTERMALALHRQARLEGIDSWYLGALDEGQIAPDGETQMIALSPDHRESALFAESFVRFGLEQPDHLGFIRDFTDYLRVIDPDIVHFHHLLQFGLEAVHAARNTLPNARLVLTAHDFYLICANNGQLYRHATKQRCPGPNLAECPRCFSNVDGDDLVLRRQNIAATLRLFDRIAVPSYLLKSKLETHLGVRLPIEFVENAYLGDPEFCETKRRQRGSDLVFGYFGNISAAKGLADLLDAADILKAKGREGLRIHVHGAQLSQDQSLTDRMDAAKHTFGSRIQFFGGYRPEDLTMLMADIDCMVFPSVWWENAPLVIYEALHHGKQVITYPHGGAQEILRRYEAGLIAADARPVALATEMERVLDDPSLAVCSPRRAIPNRKQMLAAYSALYFNQG